MTALTSTAVRSPPGVPGRDSVSSPLTILAARNVWRSIFSSSTRARIRRIGAFEQHLREARDAGQRRVDFVRDASRQQAERGHLLGNLQLLFEPHAIGHILDEQNGARRRCPAPPGSAAARPSR